MANDGIVLKKQRQIMLLILAIFILTGIAVYVNSLNNSFKFDDQLYITSNMNIRTLKNVPSFFTNPRMISASPYEAGHYRPLVVLSYAVNYAIGRLNPAGYHLVNLFFHVGTAFLLFLIVKAMVGSIEQKAEVRSKKKEESTLPIKGRDRHALSEAKAVGMGFSVEPAMFLVSLAAGLIFLVHPFNSESVNYLTARSSVMSGFFYLLGFWCWVKFREVRNVEYGMRSYFIASLLAFIAGMLSKEVVITLPIVIWLYDLYFLENRRKFSLRTYLQYLPFVLIILIPYSIIRASSFGGVIPYFKRGLLVQLYTVIPVLVEHWKMFIWPGGLTLVHEVPINTEPAGVVLFSGTLIIFYIGAALYMLRCKGHVWKIASFFMLWFIIVLLPIIIFPLNAIFQENRGYLGVVSFAVIFGVVVCGLNSRISSSGKVYKPLIVVMAIVLIIYSTATVHRNKVWGDDIRFWKDTIEKSPSLGVIYSILADEYRKHGETYLSLETVKKGISIDPDNFHLRLNLAKYYHRNGDIDNAIIEYEKALAINPIHATLWNDLGILYVQKGDIGHAEASLKKGINMWGNMPKIQFNLGVVLAGQGKLKEAEQAFRKAVNVSPGYIQARYELGDTLEKLGKSGEAMEQYREIIGYTPSGADQWALSINKDKQATEMIMEKARQRLAGMNR